MLSCFWNWKFWDFMNCHYPFISGEGTSYNNTAMIWIPINTFGPLRKGDVSMVKVTYVTPQVTQLLVDINNIRLSFFQQIYIIDQVWGQDDIDHILLCNFRHSTKLRYIKTEQKAHVAYLDSISGWRIRFMLPLGTGRDIITINYPEIKFAVCTEHIWPISTFTLLLYRMF